MPDLTERSAVELADGIRRREFTATEVVRAHIARLESTRARLNALVVDRFATARSRAAEIDQDIARAALLGVHALDDLPPLLGVPFTVKESIALAGMPNTAGLLARRGFTSSETATAVSRLIDAGAIPLGVTNTSELTLWIESENPVYGRTNNPYDQTRTAGGSSGGEGAVVGSGGAPFGVAADLAGSIRIPAMFCGVFGHKPTVGLIPITGMWPTIAGEAAHMLALGPISRSAADLMPLLRIMAGPDGHDPVAIDMQLQEPSEVSLDGLMVTVVEDSSLRPMDRGLRDARERAAGALASAGATIRTVSLPSWRGFLLPFLAALQETGPGGVAELLRQAGEPKPSVRSLVMRSGADHTLPTKLTLLAERLETRFPQLIRALPTSLTAGGREGLLDRARAFEQELELAIGDGVLLHPAHPTVAPLHGRTYGRPWLLTPAAIFNLAGVPVTEVPLGLNSQGLPLGVQVAASRGADHLTIAIALELEAVFGGWVPPADL